MLGRAPARTVPRLCIAALIVLLVPLSPLPLTLADQFVEPGITADSSGDGEVLGSQAILEGCWSPEQLAGGFKGPAKVSMSTQNRSVPNRPIPLANPGPLSFVLQGSIRSVEVPPDHGKPVALTFDLCESAGQISGYDAELVSVLRSAKVRATFFVGGKWMLSHPEQTMQLMADPLFEIGNHSWSHAHFPHLSQEQMEREILLAQTQYEVLLEELQVRKCAQEAGQNEMRKIPRIPKIFRFPYGTCTSAALLFVNHYGLAAIQWSVVTGDASPVQTEDGIVRTVRQQIKPGAIIIAHANGRGHGTVGALQRLIPELRQKGYEFVTVGQLLDLGKVVATDACYENRPNDNRHYDTRKSRRLQ